MDITRTITLTEVEGLRVCYFSHCNPLKGLYARSSLQSHSALLIKAMMNKKWRSRLKLHDLMRATLRDTNPSTSVRHGAYYSR